MNAIDFLVKEHNKVRKMLKDISDDSHRDETKREMFDLLCKDLLRHEHMEHTVWYPHFRNDTRLKDAVRHLLSEENMAEKEIKKFDNIKSQEKWEEQFSKFKSDVEHHADEEETELFPEVKRLLTEKDLEEIGKEMFHYKEKHKTIN